jgi:hypothetical protein
VRPPGMPCLLTSCTAASCPLAPPAPSNPHPPRALHHSNLQSLCSFKPPSITRPFALTSTGGAHRHQLERGRDQRCAPHAPTRAAGSSHERPVELLPVRPAFLPCPEMLNRTRTALHCTHSRASPTMRRTLGKGRGHPRSRRGMS